MMNERVLIGPVGRFAHHFSAYSQVAVLVDENTRELCYPLLLPHLPDKHVVIQIASGEEHKHLNTCAHIWGELTRHHFDRRALLVNLGGGVIGDMGGFCAATYKRGIAFIQVPTTLLAQVDASVGGKLGIDFMGYKNHIGVFEEPRAVLIDTHFLRTLPERELRSGFAEVLKHCLIADAAAWGKLLATPFVQYNWAELVAHSVAIKSRIVQQDPTEKGLRKILNFGHTIGHAVESYYLAHQGGAHKLLHGEAIAVGMIAEAWLSVRKGLLTADELESISRHLLGIYHKVPLPAHLYGELLRLAAQDKKNQGEALMFSLLQGLGNAVFDVAVAPAEVAEAMAYYEALG